MRLLYVACANKEEALAIAHALLEEKLIACANVLGGAMSVFFWDGEVREQPETVMFAKTAQAEKTIARIKELHSYDVPCVLSLDIESGNPEFMAWVEKQSS